MFKFLKEKLKSAISKISEGIEKEGKVEEKPEEAKKEEKGFFAKIKEKIVGKEEKIDDKLLEDKEEIETETTIKREEKSKIAEHKKTEPAKEGVKHQKKIEGSIDQKPKAEEKVIEKEPEKKGFFSAIREKIITTRIDEEQFEKLFWEMELALMENNVAIEVIEKIKNDLKEQLVEKPIKRTRVEETIEDTLKSSIKELFEIESIDFINKIKNKEEKPCIVAFFGINGSGKTTSIAKIAKMLKDHDISCVLSASDTFRAASIEQLQQHADKIGIKLIKHKYGSDPAAVAFDAIKHAKAQNIDVVLIDTAGRMHSNTNLIDELKKITRVAKPDLKIFVGESIAGNDCIEQAKTFNEAIGIDGIILAKADIDERGGAAVSVSYVTKKPILYLGTGQGYSDLQAFDSGIVIKNLGLA